VNSREDPSWNGREPDVLYARRCGRFYDFFGVSGLDFAEHSRAFTVTDFDDDPDSGKPRLTLAAHTLP
jgi:hypothetical protein